MRFVYESLIQAPPADVFAFHARPDALARLVPPWERVEVVRPPASLAAGTVVELRMRLGPLRIPWVAEHTACEPNVLFQDRQVRGPFRRWIHTHRFLPSAGGTLLRDEVDYELPGGAVAAFLADGAVRRRLRRMFAWRHEATRICCLG